MGRLLRFEIRKLFRQTSFYVCLAVLAALVFIGIFSTWSMIRLTQSELGVELDLGILGMFGEANRFSGRGYLLTALGGNSFSLILGIFISLYVCLDYVGGTAKNIIGRGISRGHFIASRQLMLFGASLLFSLLAWGLSFALGTVYFGAGKGWGPKDLLQLAVQFAVVLAYAAFFSFFAFLIKKSGGSIAFTIFAPMLISLGLALADIFTDKLKFDLSEFWLDGCMSLCTGLEAGAKELARCGITAGVYVIVFAGLTHLIVGRQDV